MIQQSEGFHIDLYEHQLASACEIERLEEEKMSETAIGFLETRLGIFGDPHDSGKIATMVAVIHRDRMPWDTDVPYATETVHESAGGLLVTRVITRHRSLEATLILTDPHRMRSWGDVLALTQMNYVCLDDKGKKSDIDITNCDVVVVTPRRYNKLVTSFPKCAWKRFIFDKPDEVVVPHMAKIEAGFYWFITLDPQGVSKMQQTGGAYIRSICDPMRASFDHLAKAITVRSETSFFHNSIGMSVETIEHLYYQPVYKMLQSFVSPTVLSLVEGGDIREAISALGGGETSNIVEVVKNILQRDLDFQERNGPPAEVERIRQKIEDLDSRFKERLSGVCNICLDTLKDPVLEPGCQNIFCGACLLTWLRDNRGCPMCRGEVRKHELVYIDIEGCCETVDKGVRVKSRVEAVTDIVMSNPDGVFAIAAVTPFCWAAMEEIADSMANVSMINGQVLMMATDLIVAETLEDIDVVIGMMGGISRRGPIRLHQLVVN